MTKDARALERRDRGVALAGLQARNRSLGCLAGGDPRAGRSRNARPPFRPMPERVGDLDCTRDHPICPVDDTTPTGSASPSPSDDGCSPTGRRILTDAPVNGLT